MKFSVVEIGYDRVQVDACLTDLADRLASLAVSVDSVGTGPVRDEIGRLCRLLGGDPVGAEFRRRQVVTRAEREAAELLNRAREELAAARDEARRMRDRVYAEALQARREFEASLLARRRREERVDEILRGITVVRAPADETAGTGAVPATRAAGAAPGSDGRGTPEPAGAERP
ncbi:MAG TPA: ATPase [Micromonospora sp.]